MKARIAIIGAGNMGGAIARGLASHGVAVAVSNPTPAKLDALRAQCPSIITSTSNTDVLKGASIVILAVKPWLVGKVADEIRGALTPGVTVASLAAGVNLAALSALLPGVQLARVMPNTAISLGRSTTFICHGGIDAAGIDTLTDAFGMLGEAFVIEERLMDAAMAVASCGIAYALRYMRAATEGAVQLGLRPADALGYIASTIEGAAALIRANGSNPEAEIDKVTTPGGLTIRGLNAMEAAGFSNAVVQGLLNSVTTPKV